MVPVISNVALCCPQDIPAKALGILLLIALVGDVHPNPVPLCSVCFKNVTSEGTSYLCTRCSHWIHSRCSHWVHSRCSVLRNVVDYRRANGWICTICRQPPQPRATSTMSDKAFNIFQWNANGIDNKQTYGFGPPSLRAGIVLTQFVQMSAAVQPRACYVFLDLQTIRTHNHSSTRHATRHGSNDSRLHVVEPPRGRSFIWQIGVNSSIQDRRQVDRGFLWSRVSCTRQR